MALNLLILWVIVDFFMIFAVQLFKEQLKSIISMTLTLLIFKEQLKSIIPMTLTLLILHLKTTR